MIVNGQNGSDEPKTYLVRWGPSYNKVNREKEIKFFRFANAFANALQKKGFFVLPLKKIQRN